MEEARPASGGRAAPSSTAFVGLSHLGLVTSTCWASIHDEDVVCLDLEPSTIASLGEGVLPVFEPGLEALFRSRRGRMQFTADFTRLGACDLVFLVRDAPTDGDNAVDVRPLEEITARVSANLAPGATVVVMSQAPAGFMRQVEASISAAKPGMPFALHHWVETLIIGAGVERFLHPERIILGCSSASEPVSPRLLGALTPFSCPIVTMSYESAELTKMAINLYLFSSVTFANTLSDLCEAAGADWTEIAPALRSDHRIGRGAYLTPSLGVAGGNLERDVVALSHLCQRSGVDGRLIDTLLLYNEQRYQWVVRHLEREVLASAGLPTIAVWGVSYKRDTASTKNSMALRVLHELKGKAVVRVYDPLATFDSAELGALAVHDKYDAVDGADCLLVLTDWAEFADADLGRLRAAMRRGLILDCVGSLDGPRCASAALEHVVMGRMPAARSRQPERGGRQEQ